MVIWRHRGWGQNVPENQIALQRRITTEKALIDIIFYYYTHNRTKLEF